MSRRLIASPHLSSHVPDHDAAVAGTGALVFTAGACPLDRQGRTVAAGDLAGQTRQALDNLAAALQDAGCPPADLVLAKTGEALSVL